MHPYIATLLVCKSDEQDESRYGLTLISLSLPMSAMIYFSNHEKPVWTIMEKQLTNQHP